MEVINDLLNMFSYTFMQRAFIVGILVSICSALLGVSLVLKRYSMIGDGLSHSAFGVMSVVAAINTIPLFNLNPLLTTMLIVIVIAFFLLKMSDNSKTNSDSAIALVSTFFLALGIIVVSISNGLNSDVHSILFGSLLALTKTDVITTIILSVIVIALYIIFYNKIFAITFDEGFAKATGLNVNLYKMILAILTAITIVMGMQLIGSLLISSLLIIPAHSAMKVFKTYKYVVICSSVVSIIAFVIGISLSFVISLPTGATIVAVNFIILLVFTLIELINNKYTK